MKSAGNDTIQRVSVVDNVTLRLRGALLAGEIKPGERIKVAELEKNFGVSHIPIREAVRRLEAEGLIVALPQRAAVAAGVDLDDLAGLYDLRRIVECQVIERSVDVMTAEEVDVVRACARESRGCRPGSRLAAVLGASRRVPLGSARAGSERLDPARARPDLVRLAAIRPPVRLGDGRGCDGGSPRVGRVLRATCRETGGGDPAPPPRSHRARGPAGLCSRRPAENEA